MYAHHSEWLILDNGCLADRIRECQLDIEQISIKQIDDITYMRIRFQTRVDCIQKAADDEHFAELKLNWVFWVPASS